METLAITFKRRCGHTDKFVPHGDGGDDERLRKARKLNCRDCARGAYSNKGKFLVYAARGLSQPFSIEDLVLTAWRLFPRSFGLQDGKYPCSHRVSGILFGCGGPIAKGWMERASKSHYRLTAESYLVRQEDDAGLCRPAQANTA